MLKTTVGYSNIYIGSIFVLESYSALLGLVYNKSSKNSISLLHAKKYVGIMCQVSGLLDTV